MKADVCDRCHAILGDDRVALDLKLRVSANEPAESLEFCDARCMVKHLGILTGTTERRRHVMSAALYRDVACVYREAHESGRSPIKAVAEHFSLTYRTAARWVGDARQTGAFGADPEASDG